MNMIRPLIVALVLGAPALATPQFLLDSGSVRDVNLDGTGDSLNLDSELLSLTANSDNRILREFFAGEFFGAPLASATIAGTIRASDLTEVGLRQFDFYLYAANGDVSVHDFALPGLFIGSVSYHPPAATTVNYNFDVTSAVASVLGQSGGYIGLRVECASSPNPDNAFDTSTATFAIDAPQPNGPFCFGDGGFIPNCTDCPCGNNAPPVAISGGCLNSSGLFAKLFQSGQASISNDTLAFVAEGANPDSFAVLASGENRLPSNPVHPCFGSSAGALSAAFDGLRCVGGNFRRHGARATNAFGSVTEPWGAGGNPTGGLIAQGGLAAGSQRSFQVIYRENPALVCQTGFNTSNGATVSVLP